MKQFAKIMAHVLFWSWNAIFLAFVTLGFAPVVGIQLVDAVTTGLVPWEFLAFGLSLVGVPVFSVLIGALFLRRSPGKLFALGYGVQAPLMIAVAGRFFAVRELTPGVALLLIVATVGLLALLWHLIDPKAESRNALLTCIRAGGITALLLVGLYASLWVAFYVPVVGVGVIQLVNEAVTELPRSMLRGYGPPLEMIPLMILGFLLMVYSASLFVILPLAVPIIYARYWWRNVSAVWARFNRPLAIGLPIAVGVACVAGFIWANQQPQRQVFAMLEKPPASVQESEALLKQKENLRAGLLNAYLSSYRYTSAVGEVNHVSAMYQDVLHLPAADAAVIQQWYEAVIRPFLYEPAAPVDPGMTNTANRDRFTSQNIALHADADRAAELYQRVFDQPINKAERETIVRAVRSTWNRDMATNAWQAVDDREILLVRQELSVTEHGDWADVELYEAYQNQTPQRQEVVYYFNLPESAVITGLWLGDSPDRDARYEYTVAPRGAAQSLYRNEVRRNVDPALVEQIGPRQYRLRVFPIEPSSWRWDSSQGRSHVEEAPQLHMWLTWRAMATNQGWSSPQLSDKRNVYWDRSSVRFINGQPIPPDTEPWLPALIPAAQTPQALAHRVDFDNGTTVIAEPVGSQTVDTAAIQKMHLAVVIDRSYSMAAHAEEVDAALAQLRKLNPTTPIDAYLTAPEYHGDQPTMVELSALEPQQLSFYGGQNPADLLRQFTSLQQERKYDAVLVLTDNGGYELGAGAAALAPPEAPVWMVHFGGAVPMGYDDGTLEAIQASGGGVAGSLDEALLRMATAAPSSRLPASAQNDLVDGYTWHVLPTTTTASLLIDNVQSHTLTDPFAALAARRLILAETSRQRDNLSQATRLDQLHQIATRQSIVTPYSSMIVLVNDEQRRRLAELEKRGDRFEREHEQIGETTPEGNPVVTAVPEPEEWLLIGLATALLGWLIWRRRLALSHNTARISQ
ncbi:MAG: TIGR02921 family PEP-CTERM protein [Chloroflexi bacterium]|nr:TIGR02921 family PEP-CTERM protein [Chloroflexota bacterium]